MKRFITVRLVDGSQRRFTEADLPLSIGSGPDSQVELPGSDHTAAYIGDARGHLFVQAAADKHNPVFHNDRLLSESVWLKSNDRLSSESSMIHADISGDRVVLSVSSLHPDSQKPPLLPPQGPPPNLGNGMAGEQIPVEFSGPSPGSRGRKIALAALGLGFLILACGVIFVLLARPLEINITPEPDSVTISGFPPAVSLGSRYLALPGSYRVKIAKKGYVRYQAEISVDKTAENRLSVSLEKLPGILEISVTPADGVEVRSSGELLGTTPPGTIEIAAGRHQLMLSKDRYQPFETQIDIAGEGSIQRLEALLQPDWADISVVSEPPGAELAIDDIAYGSTPATVQLLSGEHLLVLKRQTFSEAQKAITVQAGVDQRIEVQLQYLPGQVSLQSLPAGAALSVNNRYHGTTPVNLELEAAVEHQIKLSLPGYKTLNKQILLSPGQQKKLRLELEQEQGDVYLTITPAGATPTLNGRAFDADQGKLTLPATPQTLVVSAPGYRSVTRTFTPRTGFSQQITIDLVPDGAAAVTSRTVARGTSPATTASDQKLLYIEPAPFTMGAPRREPGRRANERERQVNMSKPFYLGEKPVTNAQYRMFDPTHDSGLFGTYSLNGDSQPVVNVSWDQAAAYLNWLSQRDNLEPFYVKAGDHFVAAAEPTNGYRLPTEAEWAYSARQAGSEAARRYPWSGGFPPRSVVANLADESARTLLPMVIDGYDDGYPVTSPVGSYPADSGGFYDIGGNVSEWCHDWYSAYTGKLDDLSDPLGPPTGTHKVIRGSSFKDGSVTETRLSYRAYHKEARDNVGFRIARYP